MKAITTLQRDIENLFDRIQKEGITYAEVDYMVNIFAAASCTALSLKIQTLPESERYEYVRDILLNRCFINLIENENLIPDAVDEIRFSLKRCELPVGNA